MAHTNRKRGHWVTTRDTGITLVRTRVLELGRVSVEGKTYGYADEAHPDGIPFGRPDADSGFAPYIGQVGNFIQFGAPEAPTLEVVLDDDATNQRMVPPVRAILRGAFFSTSLGSRDCQDYASSVDPKYAPGPNERKYFLDGVFEQQAFFLHLVVNLLEPLNYQDGTPAITDFALLTFNLGRHGLPFAREVNDVMNALHVEVVKSGKVHSLWVLTGDDRRVVGHCLSEGTPGFIAEPRMLTGVWAAIKLTGCTWHLLPSYLGKGSIAVEDMMPDYLRTETLRASKDS